MAWPTKVASPLIPDFWAHLYQVPVTLAEFLEGVDAPINALGALIEKFGFEEIDVFPLAQLVGFRIEAACVESGAFSREQAQRCRAAAFARARQKWPQIPLDLALEDPIPLDHMEWSRRMFERNRAKFPEAYRDE